MANQPPAWQQAAQHGSVENSLGSQRTPASDSVLSVSGGSSHDDEDEIDDGTNDAEGVWSPEIEQSFQEALAIYPPCGRRKIILSDEGKMYGRNELIARYIKLRTGKNRTRKQVSSHMQVLARRKTKDIQTQLKSCPSMPAKERALQSLHSMSSAQIVSASAMQRPDSSLATHFSPATLMTNFPHGGPQHRPWHPITSPPEDIKPFHYTPGTSAIKPHATFNHLASREADGRYISGPKLRLCEFSAYLEQQRESDMCNKHILVQLGGAEPMYTDPALENVDIRQIYDKFPDKKGGLRDLYERGPQSAFYLVKFWADLNTSILEDSGAFYGVTSQYESSHQMTISCSTKVCSFGKQVVEKVETEYAKFENGMFIYRLQRSPMCDYMITFIHKLKMLPEKYMMNSVLENFTILQVVSNKDTQETLLCIAFVFEVSTSEHGAQHHIYRLVRD